MHGHLKARPPGGEELQQVGDRHHAIAINIRHGYIEGLTISETIAHSARARAAIAGANREIAALEVRRNLPTRSYGVIARARRSDRPGVVFARAAARGEVDPLEDVDARLLCGLPLKRR